MGTTFTAKEIIRALLDDGWYLHNTVGSHQQYKHPTKPGKVTVPVHRGDLTPGTARAITKQAGLAWPPR
jgi:predicted RNA binding protein YcfA (HicA-like mRNA interferase family)